MSAIVSILTGALIAYLTIIAYSRHGLNAALLFLNGVLCGMFVTSLFLP